MKMKHNKKRNTAFLYESLIKELTKAIVRKNHTQKVKVVEIIKKYFNHTSSLKKDLDCYVVLLETNTNDNNLALRLMQEVKSDYNNLNRKEIFNQQTKLIKEINESLSPEAFANFISNYKSIASIGQYLNSDSANAKSRIILESKVSNMLRVKKNLDKDMKHIDNLTYKTFVDKFNKTYENTLKKEQKNLLTNYITSFSDNGLQLKVFINEEVGRLRESLSSKVKMLGSNDKNHKNYSMVLKKLDSFSSKQIDENMIKTLFYIQDLIHEDPNDGN